MSRALITICFASLFASASVVCEAVDDVAGSLIVFNDNGGWSWFEDERAIFDTAEMQLLVSSVANLQGAGGDARHGDIEVSSLDFVTGAVHHFTLADASQADDHNSAALWIRPDGRYVAMYAQHGLDSLSRFRVSVKPGQISEWLPEQVVDNGAATTYSNLHHVFAQGHKRGLLYNFSRNRNFDPNIFASTDFGHTWSHRGKLLTEGGGSDRPYVKYCSSDRRIDLIATQRHPRDFKNGIYHGYIQENQLFRSDGALADSNLFDTRAVAPATLTPVFLSGSRDGEDMVHRAWTIDVAIDAEGFPYAVFQARANDSSLDHRFFYARYDGSTWNVEPLAKAGGFLYLKEDDYTGLAALDPGNPNRVFISTTIDPRSKEDLPHYEIFHGTRGGDHDWNWTPITLNSTVDNIRPIIPKWDNKSTALLWLRGTYSTYSNYDMRVVGLIKSEVPTPSSND